MDPGISQVRPERAERRFWTIEVGDVQGRIGLGEAAPWPGSGVSATDLGNSTVAFETNLIGRTVSLSELMNGRWQPPQCSAAAAHGIEQALLDLHGQAKQKPVEALLNPESDSWVRTHILVDGAKSVGQALSMGVTTFKVKGGRDLETDDARLASIRSVAPNAAIRLDVNGNWSREQAAFCLDRLSRHRLEWVEQPTPADDLESLGWLRARFPLSIAADESIIHHHRTILAEKLVQVVIIKPMFLGGIVKARSIASTALENGLEVCVTHALESAVGRRGALELAASLNTKQTHGVSPLQLHQINDGVIHLHRGDV